MTSGDAVGATTLKITIIEAFEDLPDPRLDRTKRHKLMDILVITLCGAICGVDNWVEMQRFGLAKQKWFRTFLELPNGIPSHDTLSRVFSLLDAEAFQACFIRWASGLRELGNKEVIAIDGKSIRRALDKSEGLQPFHLLNAWASEAGLALGHATVAAGSNEIETLPQLINMLSIHGCIVTTDAMGCQKKSGQTDCG